MSNEIKTGDIVLGKVTKIKPFGIIVLLGNSKMGLVHISHISSSFVKDVNEFVSIGDEVTMKVLSIDNNSDKIALSMKEAHSEIEAAAQIVVNRDVGFEEKFKNWLKISNERQAGINKRNKRR